MTTALERLEKKVALRTAHDRFVDLYETYQVIEPRGGIHLSEFMKPELYRGQPRLCYRKLVLSGFYKQMPERPHHPKAAIFKRGKDFHKDWQEIFTRAGIVVKLGDVHGVEATHEVSWDFGNPNISLLKLLCTPDVVINDPERGRGLEIVELKGYNSMTVRKLEKDLLSPPEDALLQCTFYMYFTGIHKGLIIVESKDTQKFLTYEVEYDQTLIEPYMDRALRLDALLTTFQATEQLPMRVCKTVNDDLAQECALRDICFAPAGPLREQYRLHLV